MFPVLKKKLSKSLKFFFRKSKSVSKIASPAAVFRNASPSGTVRISERRLHLRFETKARAAAFRKKTAPPLVSIYREKERITANGFTYVLRRKPRILYSASDTYTEYLKSARHLNLRLTARTPNVCPAAKLPSSGTQVRYSHSDEIFRTYIICPRKPHFMFFSKKSTTALNTGIAVYEPESPLSATIAAE